MRKVRSDSQRASVSGEVWNCLGTGRETARGLQPRYNIAPSQLNPVLISNDHCRHLVQMKWGLVPSWAIEAKTSFSTINARGETLTEKPAFRKLLTSKRCLVPASGYFEWAASSAGGKQPYRIQVTGQGDCEGNIIAMAGLYDVWKGQADETLVTYTIITTEANPHMRSLHNRMPAILSIEDEEAWLNPGINSTEQLLALLRPYPGELMSAYQVGRGINNAGDDRAELILAA